MPPKNLPRSTSSLFTRLKSSPDNNSGDDKVEKKEKRLSIMLSKLPFSKPAELSKTNGEPPPSPKSTASDLQTSPKSKDSRIQKKSGGSSATSSPRELGPILEKTEEKRIKKLSLKIEKLELEKIPTVKNTCSPLSDRVLNPHENQRKVTKSSSAHTLRSKPLSPKKERVKLNFAELMLKEKDSSTWGATYANQNMDQTKIIFELQARPWLDAKSYKKLSHFELNDEHKNKIQIQKQLDLLIEITDNMLAPLFDRYQQLESVKSRQLQRFKELYKQWVLKLRMASFRENQQKLFIDIYLKSDNKAEYLNAEMKFPLSTYNECVRDHYRPQARILLSNWNFHRQDIIKSEKNSIASILEFLKTNIDQPLYEKKLSELFEITVEILCTQYLTNLKKETPTTEGKLTGPYISLSSLIENSELSKNIIAIINDEIARVTRYSYQKKIGVPLIHTHANEDYYLPKNQVLIQQIRKKLKWKNRLPQFFSSYQDVEPLAKSITRLLLEDVFSEAALKAFYAEEQKNPERETKKQEINCKI